MTAPLLLNAFLMATPSHHQSGLWRAPRPEPWDPHDRRTWLALGRRLDEAGFAAVFIADNLGLFDARHKDPVRQGTLFPSLDSFTIASVLAGVTEGLGVAFTNSTLQNQPYNLARQAASLDHLSDGRVAWNLVTSRGRNPFRNFSYSEFVEHDQRYARAEEYVDVLYRLWEGSWQDDALVRDPVSGTWADPDRVHAIDYVGQRYSVEGPFNVQPSRQRTPFLFLAGVSEAAMDLAARHTEAWTMVSKGVEETRDLVRDFHARVLAHGRRPDDVAIFQGLKFVVGDSREDARAKLAWIRSFEDPQHSLTRVLQLAGVDLTRDRLDERVDPEASGLLVDEITHHLPEGVELAALTWRELVDILAGVPDETILTGTPRQIADEVERWAGTGIRGIDVEDRLFHSDYVEFIELVLPELRARGLVDTERGSSLRDTVLRAGDRLSPRHRAAAYRRTA